MSAFSWIILSVATVYVCAQAQDKPPIYIYGSENYPSFYSGEEGVFRCKFTLSRDQFKSLAGFGVRNGGSTDIIGCLVTKVPGSTERKLSTEGESGSLTKAKCVEAYGDFNANLEAQLMITVSMEETGNYTCTWYNEDQFKDGAAVVTVDELFVGPTSLSMEVTPGLELYSGDTLEVMCKSEGGFPAANFLYEKNGEELATAPNYMVGQDDDGAIFSCKDQSHPNFKGDFNELTAQEKTIKFYFFVGTKPDTEYMIVNPSSTAPLDCTTQSNLPEGFVISYKWTTNGTVMSGETERLLLVSGEDRGGNMSESFECEATTVPANAKLKGFKVKFNITWDVETSTPTPTTTKKSTKPTVAKGSTEAVVVKQGGTTTIIIVVVVVVTVLILIIVIVIIVIKKRKGQAEVSKPEPKPTPTKGDLEQGKGDDAEVTAKEEDKLLMSQENNKSKSETSLNEEKTSTPN